ncbi:MAG: biotin--[acetyl-CoA-carboxylase] ligase [Candidatus Omnitrophica bacterium]|nr:biotin--[acetyl-CoA-carboxylase] ligase [Candidatus Omnitrophota bacterium]
MQDKLLESLRHAQGYLPPEQLCQRLGVSRQALWQEIAGLRRLGYGIVAVPHLGLRMESAPDRLYPFEVASGLHTRLIGKQIHYLKTVASTMDVAMELAGKAAAEGTVVVAETQTRGRGRLGRQWLSPRYRGLYFSVILRPDIPPTHTAVLTLLAGVAVAEAVARCSGVDVSIKWPNDILIAGRKAGGILTELRQELDAVQVAVIGVGLNVNTAVHELPAHATSIAHALGGPPRRVDRVALLQEILRAVEENYVLLQKKGAGCVLEKWRGMAATLGARVKVAAGREHVEAVAVDIDADGGLLVRCDSGEIRKFMAGDVLHL